jgi:hypothetical protein
VSSTIQAGRMRAAGNAQALTCITLHMHEACINCLEPFRNVLIRPDNSNTKTLNSKVPSAAWLGAAMPLSEYYT